MPLSSGTRLGSYEILAPLGAGGMGEVYRARDTKLDREVAIKILPQSLAADPVSLVRFEREAKAVAALSHRVSTFLCDGRTARAKLRRTTSRRSSENLQPLDPARSRTLTT